MNHHFAKSLFIFRRDLRVYDNTALYAALQQSTAVIPCFIIDPIQVGEQNVYRSINCMQFMLESLGDLDKQLNKHGGKLYIFYGKPADIVKKLIKHDHVDAVFFNRDYTPYSTERDTAIKRTAAEYGCSVFVSNDALLHAPEDLLTGKNKPYTIFTPYFKKAVTLAVPKPIALPGGMFWKKSIAIENSSVINTLVKEPNKQLYEHGGRANALTILKQIKKFAHYGQQRDFPELSTTGLSAHNKFGTCSIREEFHAMIKVLGIEHALVRQLYWRDFFTQVAYHFPHVFGHAFQEKYDHLSWVNNKAQFERWCTGTTGFPIVDAGMRQLNATGYMHNRTRMIVASFLTKDLHISWQWGERYFAQQLVDYDPCVNNGSWQWAASTGCDAQPYFRIFNPWLQQKKFDPECLYIKEWVPELRKYSNAVIHGWYKSTAPTIKNYPRPMVDHAVQSKKALALFKHARH